MSEDSATLKETLADLRITLKPAAYKMDVRPLLKVVLEAFFGPSVGLVDMIAEFIPSPVDNAEEKVRVIPTLFVSADDSRSAEHILVL